MVSKVSVIIPCLNEEKYIRQCILSLQAEQSAELELEILVIDGGSQDNTLQILQELSSQNKEVRVVHNPDKITPKSLNIGINHASHEWIMIASAHSDFEKGYLSNLILKMNELNADVVGGVMKTKVLRDTYKTRAIRKILSSKIGVGNSMFRVGVDKPVQVDTVPFGLYHKQDLLFIGGYDEQLIRNHDMEMSKRLLELGKKIYLIPTAICNYYARENYTEIAQNNFRNGKWNILTVYITKRFSSLSIRHFVPLVFVMSLFLPLILSAFFPVMLYVSLVVFGVYFSAILYSATSMSTNGEEISHLVYGFMVLHFSYGFGMLSGLFHLNKLIK